MRRLSTIVLESVRREGMETCSVIYHQVLPKSQTSDYAEEDLAISSDVRRGARKRRPTHLGFVLGKSSIPARRSSVSPRFLSSTSPLRRHRHRHSYPILDNHPPTCLPPTPRKPGSVSRPSSRDAHKDSVAPAADHPKAFSADSQVSYSSLEACMSQTTRSSTVSYAGGSFEPGLGANP
ncbi:hypothetical protein P171DRAFT_267441 [Karstenula rhodostoma CBS 690.94]|uniref:Uncharacterized protein n=1 Tax=Karstenula rhodostoma CBS 690.94 TaxID=1392251 RepID=A0A9P4PLL6_9PLEO|nr:hypothetical protein P171DRAFT_267441 [Karstenula rhodostoma CBS 690.94]